MPLRCGAFSSGGYDVRVRENVEHLAELKAAAAAQGLTTHVVPVPRPVRPPAVTGHPRVESCPNASPVKIGVSQTLTAAEAEAVRDADVVFLPSFTETERAFLLSYAQALVYTPSNEVCPPSAVAAPPSRRPSTGYGLNPSCRVNLLAICFNSISGSSRSRPCTPACRWSR